MSVQDSQPQPALARALICFAGVVALISGGLFAFQINLQVVMFLALLWVGLHARALGYDFARIRNMMSGGISAALPAIYIFVLIGMVIASFMQSGTVASLIYYGLKLLSPSIFLVAGLLLCSFMSVATGTSWGTVGTIGVVLMGIGEAMAIPLPVVAGMVVAGATFGDKLSPISDTTNLAAMSAATHLYRHIRSMLYTTVPTYILVLVIFAIMGWQYSSKTLPQSDIAQLQSALSHAYQLDPLVTLLPLAVMLLLSLKRFSPEVTMVASIATAVLIAVLLQGKNPVLVLNALWSNSPGTTGMESLDTLLGRGGILSMAWTLLLSLLALAMGGVLHEAGFLEVLLKQAISHVRKAHSLVAATIAAGIGGNLAMGEAYISIILNCQLFRHTYETANLDKAVLSRSVEEGATLSTGLIPWTTAGAFYAATLGVSTLDYAPYALLNYLNPLVSITMAYLGFGLLRPRRR